MAFEGRDPVQREVDRRDIKRKIESWTEKTGIARLSKDTAKTMEDAKDVLEDAVLEDAVLEDAVLGPRFAGGGGKQCSEDEDSGQCTGRIQQDPWVGSETGGGQQVRSRGGGQVV